MIVGAVVAIVLILYVMDRRGKNEPVDVMDGAKVVGGAGALTAGVVYALGGADAAEPMVTAVQEMFTGKPSF
jgi:ClpP class serine protease